ncbi:MAG: hypothetical protein A2W46_00940 [Alphaproteobacteria bacterium RIFCSPHIGHO2_12_42_13]|nr:MAG: hypothetical protein A2Z80_05855 [Alphaproteobacteria bacterium GWA2_41_27]OFW91292.1 MAG: hypothetical protein A2W46_00940 [Alphaproteobacteria bacterium RIFCSPHIGHO2_12_42_13]OFX06482.1 MAG: hypothetical protein A3H46_05075 [Alphaproteobacteria bacterium RIFCSPLOWO2_02_FULL_43_54]OFX08700.1 MAG: hypothetical protein A3G78_06970 [Alphaproteobacteria bacterium RIFCSPLOWO2_12_FULL_42_29]
MQHSPNQTHYIAHNNRNSGFLEKKKDCFASKNPSASSSANTTTHAMPLDVPQVVAPTLPTIHRAAIVSSPPSQDYLIKFIAGRRQHIKEITRLVDNAEYEILIACWKLQHIPRSLLSSLMKAKNKGIKLNFFVSEVENETAANYFEETQDETDDSEDEINSFTTYVTKTHAKFVLVDNKKGIFGSFNAFDSRRNDDSDSSFKISGTINQMWPFSIGLYHAYKSIGDGCEKGFGGIVAISAEKNQKKLGPVCRTIRDGSRLWFLTNLQEHEDFFRKVCVPHGDYKQVHIFSPFIYEDNARSRLKELNDKLPKSTKLYLHTRPEFKEKLESIVNASDSLREKTTIRVGDFHDKLMIIDRETLCVGSLNWMSFTRVPESSHNNIEVSIVLQGPLAQSTIEHSKGIKKLMMFSS